MGLRRSLVAALSPVDSPHTVGTRGLQIRLPNTQEMEIPFSWMIEVVRVQWSDFCKFLDRCSTSMGFSPFLVLVDESSTFTKFATLSSSVDDILIEWENTGIDLDEGIIRSVPDFVCSFRDSVVFEDLAEFSVGLYIFFLVQEISLQLEVVPSTDIFVKLKEAHTRGKKYIKNEWRNAFAKTTRKRRGRRKKSIPLQWTYL